MKAFIKFLTVCAATFVLFACGGGSELSRDGSETTPDPDGTPDVTYDISLSIADAAGNASNEVSAGNPLIVTATVTASGSTPVNDILVSFSFSADDIANFDNDTGTALTNADGIAQIGIEVGQLRGDGIVSGTVEIGTAAATGTVGFTSAGTQVEQSVPFSLELFSSEIQMETSGTDSVELTALVKNEQNVVLEGVAVSFSVDNGASLSGGSNLTAANGTVTTTLTTQNNQSNRVVMVTASTAALSAETEIEIVGTEVRLNADSSVIINDSVPVTINLVDSAGNGIAGQQVTLSSNIGTLDDTTPVSGADGQVTVNFSATSAGDAVITGSALNAEGSVEIAIQQDDFTFTGLTEDDIPLNTNQAVSVRWFKNNAALVGGTVTVTSSRGTVTPSTVTTNASGIATVNISSPFAGPAAIAAIGVDADGNQVSARASVEFVASVVEDIFVDATPDLIGPEGETSTISAVVRDPDGNLVKDKVIDFSLIDSSGGSIQPNSARTGSDGIASTVYTSNAVSPEDGVTVTASADGVTSQVSLTVGDRAFDISIGTATELGIPDTSTYLNEFAVFVSDSVGRPVNGAELTAKATPIKTSAGGQYRKGFWFFDTITEEWIDFTTAFCDNEDINSNGRLDDGEDTNGDGELTPGIVGTISFKEGIAETDQNGQATLELRYPKQFAIWTSVEVAVFGQSSGSEATDSLSLTLPIARTDVDDENDSPPPNPFGRSSSCLDAL